jgi:peptidoglycan hydrolase-like protein with peptidoglycan-binding domain/Flp pilus assembly protein TadD
MSRSCWALAEIRRRGAFVHVAGERRRFDGRLRRGPRPLPSAVSATKYAAVLVAAAMLVMAAEPARALASSGRNAQTGSQRNQAKPVVLVTGSGYEGGTTAIEVRSLQRRLDRQGYSAGAVDGRYGARTENAVERFQTARGLRVDGIAGPLTLAALRSTALYPGAGYAGAGSGQVRGLQRQLRRDGFSPGSIDGRYGPLTEGAVRRFQAAHGLEADGIAGPRTFGELGRIGGEHRPAIQPRPSVRQTRPARRHPPRALSPSQSHRRASHPVRQRSQTAGRRSPASRPGGASLPLALVLVALLAGLASGVWLIDRRRRTRRIVAMQPADATAMSPSAATNEAESRLRPPESSPGSGSGIGTGIGAESGEPQNVPAYLYGLEQIEDLAAAESAFRDADRRGDPAAAVNLGVLLEHRGDMPGAESAYRRADARGSAEGAFNLAGLLFERGDSDGALAAFRRADNRGDAAAAAMLGLALLELGDEDAAYDAYRRADQRGDPGAAVNLGVLLERRGDSAGAEAAYRRADTRGSADGAFNLGALLEQRGDLANAAAAYQRADQRGDAGAAARLGMLLERQYDYAGALSAYDRAQRSDRSEVAELARSRAQALAFGLSVAEKGQR